jgi:hypothetical protein
LRKSFFEEYMPNPATITLTTAISSVPGASTPVNLDWFAGSKDADFSVLVLPSTTGTSSALWRVEITADDLMQVAPSLVRWSGISSSPGQGATIFGASTTGVDGLQLTFTSPWTAVRINSTNLSSGPLTLKVVQASAG